MKTIRHGISRLTQDDIKKRVEKASKVYDSVFRRMDNFYYDQREDKKKNEETKSFIGRANPKNYDFSWADYPFRQRIYFKALNKIEKAGKFYRSISNNILLKQYNGPKNNYDFVGLVQFYQEFVKQNCT